MLENLINFIQVSIEKMSKLFVAGLSLLSYPVEWWLFIRIVQHMLTNVVPKVESTEIK